MRIKSCSLINSGTFISYPFSNLAGLVTLVAVSPRAPGSVSKISTSTKLGKLISIGR